MDGTGVCGTTEGAGEALGGDVAQFVKDVGYGSVPVWRIVD